MNSSDVNSSTITREIQRQLHEAACLRRAGADRHDPRLKAIMFEIDMLSRQRMRLNCSTPK